MATALPSQNIKSDDDSINQTMKFPKYFPYLVAFCILFCLGVLVVSVFSVYIPNIVRKLTLELVALLSIIIRGLIIITSFKIYKKAAGENHKILQWFVAANIILFLTDLKENFFIRYSKEVSVFHLDNIHFILSTITVSIWAVVFVAFLYKMLKTYVISTKQQIVFLFVFIPVTIAICLLFLSSVHYFTKLTLLDGISQIVTSVAFFIIFDFIVLCLVYAKNNGFVILLLGFVVQTSGYFFFVYLNFSEVNLSIYNSNPLVYIPIAYGGIIWFVGVLLNWLGILMIQYRGDYTVKNWVRPYNSIKSKLAFWVFSVSVSSFLLFFILAYAFSLISKTVFLGLPIFIMIYSAIIIMLSIYVGGHFEAPFKQITANIKILMRKNTPTTTIHAEFSIAEFIFLQQFIVDSFARLEQTQEKFRTIVKQTLHDIQSPITSLNTIVTTSSSIIPENTRVTLRHATDRIADITNNLLKQYQTKEMSDNDSSNVLVSLALLQIMREKRYEYSNALINFNLDFEADANFAFIKINPDSLKRMVSNLINNAVEALHNDGIIEVKLTATLNNITLSIKDNGHGMPQHIQDKFHHGISVTEGKANGQGLGLLQIRETIITHGGTFVIHANDIVGTEIVITFPRVTTPSFITSAIKLKPNDIIVVLDDDESIHGAWDVKLAANITQYPTLQIKHFTQGQEAIAYINSLTNDEKNRTLLLTDYELLDQGMNGLDVVTQTQMKRAILVTSWATNAQVQEMVINAGITTIPKELTSAVSIIVEAKSDIPADTNSASLASTKMVDMVWLEDNKWFVDGLVDLCFKHIKVDIYYDPLSFMRNIRQYPFDTKIILDTFYKAPDGTGYTQTGYTIAEELHQMGYTKLILFSGDIAGTQQIPEYLTAIGKHDHKSVDLLATI